MQVGIFVVILLKLLIYKKNKLKLGWSMVLYFNFLSKLKKNTSPNWFKHSNDYNNILEDNIGGRKNEYSSSSFSKNLVHISELALHYLFPKLRDSFYPYQFSLGNTGLLCWSAPIGFISFQSGGYPGST